MIKFLKGMWYTIIGLVMFILELIMSALLFVYTPVYFVIDFFKICYGCKDLADVVADYVLVWYHIWGWIGK